jgi:hypothetical protein
VDITGTPDLAVEVKARADFAPTTWMHQAERNAAGRFPIVVYRGNGMGEDAGQYLAIVRLADVVDLLTTAGYGDGQQGNGVSVSRYLGSQQPPPIETA